MAILRGEQGTVQFETGSGTLAVVVGTRSWSLSATKETYDVTDHGATFRSFIGGLISGSGTVELVYDPDATNQPELIEDVFKANDAVDATLNCSHWHHDHNSFTFAGIVTDMEISSTVGELVIVSCNFITSGDITSNA